MPIATPVECTQRETRTTADARVLSPEQKDENQASTKTPSIINIVTQSRRTRTRNNRRNLNTITNTRLLMSIQSINLNHKLTSRRPPKSLHSSRTFNRRIRSLILPQQRFQPNQILTPPWYLHRVNKNRNTKQHNHITHNHRSLLN